MKEYNKLVRDKIPEIIKNDNCNPITKILDDETYKKELDKKLLEEVNEYLKDDNSEEIADVLEIIYSILDYKKISKEEIENIRIAKKQKRGGFDEKIFLERVED
jgi:predicted house-cleaning noncanonical NTP pyrophosphatase (MazG superfamily)